jgi:uncharacterized protein
MSTPTPRGRWLSGDTIGYARTESGSEIDLAPVSLPARSGVSASVPLECKWVDQGWRSGTRTISGRYGHGILATKSILDTEADAWAVPAPPVAPPLP